MLTFGIKVSEPGHSVWTAEDKNLSLKTGMTLLKVYKAGNISLSSSGWNTVSHSLGYVPQYLAYVKDPSYTPDSVFLAKGYFGQLTLPSAIAKINTSNLYLYKTYTDQNAFYYIFYEPVDTGTAPSVVEEKTYGLKISKDGKDVKSANILEQTFNSEKNSIKIITDGFTTSTASGSRTVNIAHNLPFIPGFLVYFEVDSSGSWFFDGTEEDISGKLVSVNAQADSTNLVLSIYSSSSASVRVHYFILADNGENI